MNDESRDPGRWARVRSGLTLALQWASHALFWGWNGLAVLTVWVGLGPEVMVDLVRAAWAGVVPTTYLWTCGVLWVVPVLGLVLGALWWRRSPARLMALLYGVELPVMVAALLRLFAIHELTPSLQLAVGALSMGIGALLWALRRGPEVDSALGQVVLTVGLLTGATVGVWWSLVLGSVAVPVSLDLLRDIARALTVWSRPVGLLWTLAGIATAAVFVVFPVAMAAVLGRSAAVGLRGLSRQVGRGAAVATAVVTVGGLLAAGVATSQQQAEAAMALSEDPVAALSDPTRVHEGLVDAYLSSYRYLGGPDVLDEVGRLWDRSVAEGAGDRLRPLWAWVYSPLLYEGFDDTSWDDPSQAAERYRAVFDTPIERAAQDRIVWARRNTWQWWDAAAGMIDAGEERVWLEQQEVSIRENGGAYVVTVHDVLRNRTPRDREVVVTFSLPDNAAITGLWLGEDDDQDAAFTHRVSPRGAAQQVYAEQVRRSVDPALVEQVGPNQYRLKAFPVPARGSAWEDAEALSELGRPMHVWLEYAVLPVIDDDGGWVVPAPQVSEVRNLYWTADTVRTVNGAEVVGDAWVPELGPAEPPDSVTAGACVAEPVGLNTGEPKLDNAVLVVDLTRSMAAHRPALVDALEAWGDRPRVCVRHDGLVRCPSGSGRTWTLAGSLPLASVLAEAAKSHVVRTAGDVVLLTDASTYDTAVDGIELPRGLPGITAVHLGGLAAGYSDAVAAQLEGGAFESWEAFMDARRGAARDGWRVKTGGDCVGRDDPLMAIFTVQHVRRLARFGADLSALSDLDGAHALAVSADVVTPVSSMIVLVNLEQHRRLDDLEARSDRFEREVESGATSPLGLSTTPEPHEWALLLVAAVLLVGGRRLSARDQAQLEVRCSASSWRSFSRARPSTACKTAPGTSMKRTP